VNLTRSCIVITSPRCVVQGCTACLRSSKNHGDQEEKAIIVGVHD